ncbi:MAG: hypothetical protein JWP85_462 [Rhodoglobus sp.]|nr:hypothetical protein [Rhodoglobus sp.]
MTGIFVAVAIAFLAILWILTAVRRRGIRTYLLAAGAQTRGVATLQPRRGRREPSIAVRYTDADGVTRTAVKSVVSAGDSELVKKPAMVLYHPRRTSRDDYVLLGFGEQPSRWFRADFARIRKSHDRAG